MLIYNIFLMKIDKAYTQTDKAIFANFGGTAFGDIAFVPGPNLKYPKGIRDIEAWYVPTVIRRNYVYEVFERQCEIALKTGTDFGTQIGTYRELYMPFHKATNDWIHKNTEWKTFIHSCGAVFPLIEHFVEAGFDILNPVQCSCPGMEPERLKEHFGSQITFWGDTSIWNPRGS